MKVTISHYRPLIPLLLFAENLLQVHLKSETKRSCSLTCVASSINEMALGRPTTSEESPISMQSTNSFTAPYAAFPGLWKCRSSWWEPSCRIPAFLNFTKVWPRSTLRLLIVTANNKGCFMRLPCGLQQTISSNCEHRPAKHHKNRYSKTQRGH